MPRKLLLDTNIILDAAMSERPEHEYALLLLDEFEYGEALCYVCASSLKDVYYVLSKYAGENDAREFVRALMDVYTVVSVDLSVCKCAIDLNEPDFEDGIIRVSAESLNVDFIISRDENAFIKSSIKRLSAKDYIELFCNSEQVSFPL